MVMNAPMAATATVPSYDEVVVVVVAIIARMRIEGWYSLFAVRSLL
jgi:hypothetical protein